MAVSQTKDGRWYVSGRPGFFPDDPKRRREYFGRGAAAEHLARARDAQIRGDKPVRNIPDSGPTFAALAAIYRAQRRLSPKSLRELDICLEKIILPLIGNLHAIRLTNADIDSFSATRRAHKTKKGTYVKNSTIRREITIIKAVLNWSANQTPQLIAFNPVANYRLPASDDDSILPPTAREAALIVNNAADHLRRAITLSWYLGLRPGAVELLTLGWEYSVQCPLLPDAWDDPQTRKQKYAAIDAGDIDSAPSAGVIRIRSAHKGGPQLRDVPIHAGLMVHLSAWHRQDKGRGPLIHYHGHAVKTIQTAWHNALQRAGITRRIRPYDLRHAYITTILERGGDIGALSEIVGSRPETLRRHYQHVSRELTRKTVQLIPELATPAGTTKNCSTRAGPANKRPASIDKD